MSVTAAISSDVRNFADESKALGREHDVFGLLSPVRFFWAVISVGYIFIQRVIIALFKPRVPKPGTKPKAYNGRIAVIGAGLTGVSSAAHAAAHGFDVVIFEANDMVGGIWANVNSTSGLQLNSILYRFHPAVLWSRGFPLRDEILAEIARVWTEYGLEPRTRFNTPVTSVRRVKSAGDEEDKDPNKLGHARWEINDGAEGVFDAVIVTVGTCGEPMMIRFPGMPQDGSSTPQDEKHSEDDDVFRKPILHSSQLDSPDAGDLAGKTVVVIGSGASGVEAVETALRRGARKCTMVARDDKWIIPRNFLLDTLIAAQPFGREMPLSGVWEWFIKKWHYQGVEGLVPAHRGLFEGTPVVNDAFLAHVRAGACEYVRGDTRRLTAAGVLVNERPRGSKPGDEGKERVLKADVVVLATGFHKPTVDFLPRELFPEGYKRPDLYLQNFCTEDWSVLMTNSSYMNGIGTVGHFHIGIYARILLTLLLDRSARPAPKDMKLWVDAVRFVKRGAAGGALGFFTYMELTLWLVMFHVFRPDRLRWIFFIMQGWGVYPERVPEE